MTYSALEESADDIFKLKNQQIQSIIVCNKLYDSVELPKCEMPQKNETNITTTIGKHPEMLLFAENMAYDMFAPSEDGIQGISFSNDYEMKLPNDDLYLTGSDLLMFAKQIATGMVSDFFFYMILTV